MGRYGTLALGALALVMALGAWLSWAIENYRLSDTARVAAGALAALTVGGIGLWLRGRGAARYGNVLLGIALALVHVDAWGAGPMLHVVPTPVALALAAAASAALAVLAYRNDEESLFLIGVGGALAAPFVTTDGRGSVPLLLLYGWVVLGGSIYALRGRAWRWAHWLVVNGAAAYATVGAVNDPPAGAPWYLRDAPLFFALNVAATAWAGEPAERRRGVLARRLLYVALLPAFIYHDLPAAAVDRVALAFAGTVLGYLALRGAGDGRSALVDRLALPLLFGSAALAAVLAASAPAAGGAGVALLWAGAAVAAPFLWPGTRDERAADLAVAGVASAVALPVGLDGAGSAAPAALAAHAALFALVLRREWHALVAVPVALSLAVATAWSWILLAVRPHYDYPPFATPASLAAAATVAAGCAASWLVVRRAMRDGGGGLGARAVLLVGAVGPALAVLWGSQELAYAVSPAVASFALIAFWAAAGVTAILVGRARGIAAARQAGLGLSILAALKAVGQASDEQSIGLRIGSYLVVGVFLLAVAYWYRAVPEPEAPSPA